MRWFGWFRPKPRDPEPEVHPELLRQIRRDALIQQYGGKRKAMRAVMGIQRQARRREKRRSQNEN